MEIFLKDQTEIVSWKSAFRLLAYEPVARLWKLLGIPEEVCAQPDYMLNVSQLFLDRSENIVMPENRVTREVRVSDLFEAHRMVGLGHLYLSFGLIAGYYGAETAYELLRWCERNFVISQGDHWHQWSFALYKASTENSNNFQSVAKNEDRNALMTVLNEVLDKFETNRGTLKAEIENLVRIFESSQIHQESLRSLVLYDISDQLDHLTVSEALNFLFNFDLILFRNFSYHFWYLAYKKLSPAIREQVFTWGQETWGLGSREIKQHVSIDTSTQMP